MKRGKYRGETQLSNVSLQEMINENEDGVITYQEVQKLLDNLGITLKQKDAKRLFRAYVDDKDSIASTHQNNGLVYDTFEQFFTSLTMRPEITELYHQIELNVHKLERKKNSQKIEKSAYKPFGQPYNNIVMTTQQLMNFLRLVQKESDTKCDEVMKRLGNAQNKVRLEDFHRLFLNDVVTDALDKDGVCRPHDMTHPLSHYFIDSSHNTYLTGDQLFDKSAVSAYTDVLNRGCRCVELDCWDVSGNPEPVIYHGKTRTSKILFKDVIKAIAKFLETNPDCYPIILSLEVHCDVNGQDHMAEHLKTYLESKQLLYTADYLSDTQQLPSPEKLRGKCVIKAKKIVDLASYSESTSSVEDDELDAPEMDIDITPSKHHRRTTPSVYLQCTTAVQPCETNRNKNKRMISQKLSDYVVICRSTKFDPKKDLFITCQREAIERDRFLNICSFSERRANELMSKYANQWRIHNQFQLTRVYPFAMRFDSSNFRPLPMWLCGIQIVALNHQTCTIPMFQDRGFFLQNNGCGYVLKPDFLLQDHPQLTSKSPKEWRQKLQITVISAYRLPVSTYKGLCGLSHVAVYLDDGLIRKKFKTKPVQTGGFHPVWNNTYTFCVYIPEMAVVTFVIKFKPFGGSNTAAQCAVPLKHLKEGYRIVHLKTREGENLPHAQLFIFVKKSAFKDRHCWFCCY